MLSFRFSHLKFRNDLEWNLLGFAVIAICGLLINILIIWFYDFSFLGFFNLLLIFFLVLSQITSWGVGLSVQKLIPEFQDHKAMCCNILSSSLLIYILLGLVWTLIWLLLRDLPGQMMRDPLLRTGFVYLIPGIFLSAINRIFLAFLNGMRLMKSFALFNALRVVLMLGFLTGFLLLDLEREHLGLIFSIPELLLCPILMVTNRNFLHPLNTQDFKKFGILHLRYGNKALLGSVVTNFQSKVDIFILGFFVSNTMLGVYSFAAFVADGFQQIFYVFRGVVNPVITEIRFHRSKALLRRFFLRTVRGFYRIFLVLGTLLAILYPVLLLVLNLRDHVKINLSLFYIFLIGILVSSGWSPFQFFFNQIGRPKEQSNFLVLLFLLTILLSLMLVPYWGVYGAAIANLLVNLFQLFYIRRAVRKLF